jgi:hypothetical protein
MPASVATLEKKLHGYKQKLANYDRDFRSSDTRILHSKADLEEWIAKTEAQIEKAKVRESKRPYKHMPQEQDGGRRKSRRRKSRRGTRRR